MSKKNQVFLIIIFNLMAGKCFLILWSAPLEFLFQEQSYSSLHLGQSLAWNHVSIDIVDPYGAIADFCGVIADSCGVVAIPEAIGGCAVADTTMPIIVQLAKHHKTLLNIMKHM